MLATGVLQAVNRVAAGPLGRWPFAGQQLTAKPVIRTVSSSCEESAQVDPMAVTQDVMCYYGHDRLGGFGG